MSVQFKYTDMSGLDSSLAKAVYYNADTGDLGIVVHGAHSGVLVYSNVPVDVFNGFVDSDSAGSFYNTRIRGVYTNPFGATRYDVEFIPVPEENVENDKKAGSLTAFKVRGSVEFSLEIDAVNPEAAVAIFKEELAELGYDEAIVNVKEVVIPFG